MQLAKAYKEDIESGAPCPDRWPPECWAAVPPALQCAWLLGLISEGDLRTVMAKALAALAAATPPKAPAPLASVWKAIMGSCPYRWVSARELAAMVRQAARTGDPPHPYLDPDAIMRTHQDFCHCKSEPDKPCEGATLAWIAGWWQPLLLSEIPEEADFSAREYRMDADAKERLRGCLDKWVRCGYIREDASLRMDSPAILAERVRLELDALPLPGQPLMARVEAAAEAAAKALLLKPPGADKTKFATVAYGDGATIKSRLVADCSRFLNGFVPHWPMRYEHPLAIACAMTEGCYMATRDFKGAYLHVRLAPEAQPFIGFHMDGKAYVYDGATMGIRTSCAAFSSVSAYVVELCRFRGMDKRVIAIIYIDDVTFLCPDKDALKAALAIFDATSAELGLAIDMSDPKNTKEPTTTVVALGFLFDSVAMSVGLPDDKLAVRALDTFIMELCMCPERQIPVPKATMESYAGKITHLAMVYPQLRPASRKLHAASEWKGDLLHLWKTNHSILQQVREAVTDVAAAFRAGPLREQRKLPRGPRVLVCLSSDASGTTAWGARVGSVAFWGPWTTAQASLSIAYKELWPLYCLLKRFASGTGERDWRGQIVHLTTDNIGNVYNVSAYAANGDAAELMSRIVDLCSTHGIILSASWLPREFNAFCDALSKCSSLVSARDVCSASSVSLCVISPRDDDI